MKRVIQRAPLPAHPTLLPQRGSRPTVVELVSNLKKRSGNSSQYSALKAGEIARIEGSAAKPKVTIVHDGTLQGARVAVDRAVKFGLQRKAPAIEINGASLRGDLLKLPKDPLLGGEILALPLPPSNGARDIERWKAPAARGARLDLHDMFAQDLAATAVAAGYRYNRLKSASASPTSTSGAKKSKKGKVSGGGGDAVADAPMKISLRLGDRRRSHPSIRAGAIIGEAVNDARTLGNLREDEGTPEFYVDWAKTFVCGEKGVRMANLLRGDELKDKGLNLFHAVGRAAEHPPAMAVMEYRGNKSPNAETIAIVGKGVTFDSGGMNIKAFGSMETMYMDMMGAAAVLATMRAVARLKLPINLVGVVGLAENAIGPTALQPSSIITSLKGTTVEVTNTDAEGRLILADCLTFVQKHASLASKPTKIIDLATLTGAILVALGSTRAGAFGNDPTLFADLYKAALQVGEPIWPMPIGQEHVEALKGMHSDLINCSANREAGSCTAAAFLKHFIEDGTQWVHLDIAGPGMGGKAKGLNPDGAPGFAVRMLLRYLINCVGRKAVMQLGRSTQRAKVAAKKAGNAKRVPQVVKTVAKAASKAAKKSAKKSKK